MPSAKLSLPPWPVPLVRLPTGLSRGPPPDLEATVGREGPPTAKTEAVPTAWVAAMPPAFAHLHRSPHRRAGAAVERAEGVGPAVQELGPWGPVRPGPLRSNGWAFAANGHSATASMAGASAAPTSAAAASPPEQFPDKEAFFGEAHIHTASSFDAFLGGARLEPEGAYRFARSEQVEMSGQRFRLQRPLDWAAVTDLAEDLGEMKTILQPRPRGTVNPWSRMWRGREQKSASVGHWRANTP